MSDLTLDSKISDVTVYRDGALVTRTAMIPATFSQTESKNATIHFKNLPLCLHDNTVTISVEGNAFEAIGHALYFDVPTEADKPKPPADQQIDDLQFEIGLLEAKNSTYQHFIKTLAANELPGRKQLKNERPAGAPITARLDYLQFYNDQHEAAIDKIRFFKKELHKLKIELQNLVEARRLATTQREAQQHELRKAISVQIRTGSVGSTESKAENGNPSLAKITLTYHVPGARWSPSYVFRFSTDYQKLTMQTRALVGQNTGEDWSEVNLHLSTANPMAWHELPEMKSLRIGRRQHSPTKTGWRPLPDGLDELYADYDQVYKHGLTYGGAPFVDASEVHEEIEAEPYTEDFDDDDFFEVEEPITMSKPLPVPAAPVVAKSRGFGGGGSYRTEKKRSRRMKSKKEAMPPQPVMSAMAGDMDRSISNAMPPSEMFDLDLEDQAELFGTLTAGENHLDYGSLQMPSASSSNRGKLQPLANHHRALTYLRKRNISISFSLELAISASVTAANQIMYLKLPAGGSFAHSPDSFDYIYHASHPVSIASDAQFSNIPLNETKTSSDLTYICAPRDDAQVFRVAKVTNESKSALLQGPVDIYCGDEFLMRNSLETTPPAGEIALGLGVEQGIKVARNTNFSEETTGLISGTLNLHHTIEIEVQNTLKQAIKIEIQERIPHIPDSEMDAEISVTSVTPAWKSWKPQDYILESGYKWIEEVPAGGKMSFNANYTIEIPSKQEIIGGNRRES